MFCHRRHLHRHDHRHCHSPQLGNPTSNRQAIGVSGKKNDARLNSVPE